jgi:hypothetical protein
VAIGPVLTKFQGDASQCDSLIANAHRSDANGAPLFPALDRSQITVAAFLNLYIAWETFLESAIAEYMLGASTISGAVPTKYVSPLDRTAALAMTVGAQKFFDYGNPEAVKKIVLIYFQDGRPFLPPLHAITTELSDLRTMRNASAHVSSTTQRALESLAQRVFGTPSPAIDLYTLLTRATAPNVTVFEDYKTKLLVTAQLIAQG